MLLLDSFFNECCFKDCSMGLKVHTNRKRLKTTPRCLGHREVATPQCPMYQGVVTPRCPIHRGVAHLTCWKSKIVLSTRSRDSLVSNVQGSWFLFLWTFKPMLQPLKQHSFKNLSIFSIYYTNSVKTCLKQFPNSRFLGRLPGVQSTRESF